uniref:Thrombomodulin-like n=1 Tax=Callorhinchus milii TaxID=7868 RepID=A0A4W3HVZ3_CALMI|eukprot:gi/632953933/ref/XP_007892692.1/ PREDICTED: thrombomodulin-like [Callorhinchus milii]
MVSGVSALLLSAIALAQLVHSQGTGDHQKDAVRTVCIRDFCYILQQESRKFNMARNLCIDRNSDAMTVRSAEAAEALSQLLQSAAVRGTNFWIGLQLHRKKCPNNDTELRGYQWMDGDTDTVYSNWKSVSPDCGSRCVTVSRDLTWEDRPCNVKADGIVCEVDYSDGMCPELHIAGGSVVYRTPFGAESSDLSHVPPQTIASLSPSGLRLECVDKVFGVWSWNSQTPGPWECEVDGDAYSRCRCRPEYELKRDQRDCSIIEHCRGPSCHYLCVDRSGAVFCTCRDGYELDEDGRSCNEIDECLRKPCAGDEICSNTPGSFSCHCPTGYRKTDAHTCEDINECSSAASPCAHKCGNTLGSFTCSCYSGYRPDPEDFTKCVTHCPTNSPECAPICFGSHCDCPEGYILDEADTPTCVNIEECPNTECEYDCINSGGTHTCTCPLGSQLKEDGKSCEKQDEDGSGSREMTEGVPTPTSPTNRTGTADAHITLAALLGIIFSIVVLVLVLACLGHHLLKKSRKWQASSKYKSPKEEQDVNLSQVLSAGDVQQKQSQFTDEKAELRT